MSLVRLLMLAGLVGFIVQWWIGRDTGEAEEGESPSGFVSAAMPNGADGAGVIILAPTNCPSDAAQRADALAAQLEGMGIPIVRSSRYSASSNNPSAEERADLERALTVLQGEVPAVFVNGMAKANPTAEEVAAEFARDR